MNYFNSNQIIFLNLLIKFTFLIVSSSLSVCLSKAVSTEFLRALSALANSLVVTEVARALSSATEALSKFLAFSVDPVTLRRKRPEPMQKGIKPKINHHLSII